MGGVDDRRGRQRNQAFARQPRVRTASGRGYVRQSSRAAATLVTTFLVLLIGLGGPLPAAAMGFGLSPQTPPLLIKVAGSDNAPDRHVMRPHPGGPPAPVIPARPAPAPKPTPSPVPTAAQPT